MVCAVSQWVRAATLCMAVLVAVPAVAASTAAEGAAAEPPAATFMRIYGGATVPNGWTDFCSRTPASCRPAPSAAPRIALTAIRWQELREINVIVNHAVAARSDQELYGVSERWTLPSGSGDCEDYGLLKQKMLIERGWPRGALLMTVVRDENGEGHAVLTVATKSGDLILDNRHDRIIAWQSTPYGFVKRQSTTDPKVWLALEPAERPELQHSASAGSPDAARIRQRMRK